MTLKERLLERFSPPDERQHLDRKIESREARLARASSERERLLRLQKMIEVKGGDYESG